VTLYSTFKYYEDIGLEVSAGKTFIDKKRDEFLRLVAEVDGKIAKVRGYPVRLVNSLLWKNPVNEPDDVLGVNQMVSRAALWRKGFVRGFEDVPEVQNMVVTDLWRCTGGRFSKDAIREWIDTPASLGGAGGIWKASTFQNRLGFEPEVYARDTKWKGDLPGLVPLFKQAEAIGVNIDATTICNKVFVVPGKPRVLTSARFLHRNVTSVSRDPHEFTPGRKMSLRWLESISPWLQEACVAKAKDLRDPLWLRQFLSPGSVSDLERTVRSFRKRLVWDWIDGKCGWPVGWDGASGEEYIAGITNASFWGWWASRLNKRGTNMSHLVRASLTWERGLTVLLMARNVVVGS
jgi:hypothetical protein